MSVIDRRQRSGNRPRRLRLQSLRCREAAMRFMSRHEFGRRGPGVHAIAAIETRVIAGEAIVDYGRVVDIGHVHVGDIGHGTVVIEIPVAPITTGEADAEITEAVVDAAVKSYVGRPIAFPPRIGVVGYHPVSRRPKQSRRRCEHPGSGHPIVIFILVRIRPVSGRPNVSRCRARWLHVHRQCGRRKVHRHTDVPMCK